LSIRAFSLKPEIHGIRSVMIHRLTNLYKLIQIFRERGNWKLIRRARGQLLNFILCREGMNKRPLFMVPFYWHNMMEGLDVLVWRLETFGFLFLPGMSEDEKQRLNRCL
jgi:hypothetical protein